MGSIDSARGRALIDAYKFQLKHLPEQEAEDAGEGKLTDEELEAALDEQLQAVRMRIRSKREANSAEA